VTPYNLVTKKLATSFKEAAAYLLRAEELSTLKTDTTYSSETYSPEYEVLYPIDFRRFRKIVKSDY
jgi:hypothetical protein